MKKRSIKYLLNAVLIFVVVTGLTSCRGLIEHIREAQQQGREQNESSYKVVFPDDDIAGKTTDKPRRKKDEAVVTVGADYAVYQTRWKIPLEGTEDLQLLAEVDSWLGTPYRYGGTTRQGTDCSGMVMSIYKKLYNIDTERSAYDLWKSATLVKKNQLKSGDLVFFKINRKQISHVGIYIANGYFVHASSSRGVIIDNLDTAYYAERFATGGRVHK